MTADDGHGVALQEKNRIVCICGTICDAKIGKSAAPMMGSASDYFVAVPASTVFARHLRRARADALDGGDE